MRPKTLDHVALWVADRDGIADFLTERLSMHVIERTDKFTLVGTDARRGKLTLFAEEGPRERGALKHVALRVSDLEKALSGLDGIEVSREDGGAYFDVAEGLRLGVVEGETAVEYDLDHVALFSATPGETAKQYEQFGFAADGDTRVEVGVSGWQANRMAKRSPVTGKSSVNRTAAAGRPIFVSTWSWTSGCSPASTSGSSWLR